MGSLTPGATYIYETVDGIIFAREFGKTERRVVGYTKTKMEQKKYRREINHVLDMCETDLAMEKLLEQLFVLYNLKKANER